MAGVALVNPKIPFYDALGAPLVGGFLDVYLAGTTTRTNTWQDKAQTTLNTNPIVLDARGECTLWADDALTYKFVLKTAAGVALWTADNISGANVSGTLVTFTQAGAGAIARTAQNKLREVEISDADFGATMDGVADDTAEIQALLTEVQAQTMAGTGGIYGAAVAVGTGPVVKLPSGVRKISSALTADTNQAFNYRQVVGENTVIVPTTNAITVFGGVGYQTAFKGLIFSGGAVAISHKTGNADSTHGLVEQCEFHLQATACVQADATSNSSSLVYRECNFIQNTLTGSGYVAKFLSGDFIMMRDCWITCWTPIAIENRGNLTITGGCGADGGNLTHWIYNYGNLRVQNFSFGGHGGGAIPVRNYADTVTDSTTATWLSIRDSQVYSNSYLIEFYKIPNIITLENIDGIASPTNNIFYFDSALTYTDFFNWQKFGQLKIGNVWAGGLSPSQESITANTSVNGDIGRKVFLAALARTGQIDLPRRSRLRVSEIRGSGEHGGGWATNISNAGLAYADDAYLVQNAVITATADNGNFDATLTTYLNQAVLTYGEIYTLTQVVDVEAGDGATVTINIGGARKTFQLARGKHILDVPFVYLNNSGAASATYDTYAWIVNIRRNGGIVRVGRHMLTVGMAQYTSEVLTLEGTGAPAAYTVGTGYDVGYFRGDRNFRTNVAAAGPEGDTCVTEGAPGAWKAWAAIAA
jgi:hypothetical protein